MLALFSDWLSPLHQMRKSQAPLELSLLPLKMSFRFPDFSAPFDMVAYYASLLLQVSLIPEPLLSPSPSSPPCNALHDVGGLDLDLPALVRLYRPFVYPDHVEYTMNSKIGLCTVRYTLRIGCWRAPMCAGH